ncbi:uncharacterized protein LOC123723365 [Papilio machaon]|uniref:uncharacterized protein LOC123723365 n=1 Tax=Papilio machaon TaxID=76193 RepID=UPI001E663792|nr:uncharacterized protein LOC123723365 [Papilio machaon]
MTQCFKCDGHMQDDKNAKITCKGCKRAICIKCSGLTATELRVFGLQNPKLSYLCDDCEEGLRQVPALRKLVTELQHQVQELSKQRSNAINLDMVIHEIEDRKNRSRNVIMYGLPESSSTSPEDRKEHDKLSVTKSLASLPAQVPEIVSTFRLGKPSSNNSKPRPLKVVLTNKHGAITVLKNKNKLPKAISVQSDMTPYQRDELKKLRDELADRIDKGEKDLTIKYINKVPRINNMVEALWLDIQYRELNFLMACVYRPPSSSLSHLDEILFDTIEKAASENTVIIAGDFNLPKIKWPLQKTHDYDSLCENFVNMYTNSNLNQLITQITRKRNHEESLLDLIFCNDDSLMCDIDYHPPIGKSDHLVITATIQAISSQTLTNENVSTTQYDFFKADYEKLSLCLANNITTVKESVGDMWFTFKNQILDSIEKCIPKKKIYNKHCTNKPWINKEILKLIKRKKELWKNYRIDRDEHSYKDYRNVNNKIISLSRSRRAAFESTIIESGPKAFYGYIRKQLNSKVCIPNIIKNVSNELVTKPEQIAEAFADQFKMNLLNEPDGPMPSINVPRVTNPIQDLYISGELVRKTLSSFNDTTASGPDDIPSVVLNKCSEVLSDDIAKIMNKSLKDGLVPEDWKRANVVPIYKKGNKLLPANYRPISLTCILCKTMEKIIANHIRPHIQTRKERTELVFV